jgi:hypothetical protein
MRELRMYGSGRGGALSNGRPYRDRVWCFQLVRTRPCRVCAPSDQGVGAADPYPPVGSKTSYVRKRGMRIPLSFMSRNATYIIAVINASLKASC